MELCEKQQITELLAFYRDVSEHTDTMPVYGKWIYGVYPTEAAITAYTENGQISVCMN